MTTYNTGNPIGSTDPRDLKDNAENFDHLSIGDQDTYNDRLGKPRRSWISIERQAEQQQSEFESDQANRESEFNADQTYRANAFQAAQDDREGVFNSYLVSAGYQFAGDYAAGIEITQYNQVVRDSSGEFWRASGSTALPYTTTEAGLPEGGAFVTVGDAALRQELGLPVSGGNGALRVSGSVIYVNTFADLQELDTSGLVDGQAASVQGSGFKWDSASQKWRSTSRVGVTAFGVVGDGVTDDHPALQAYIDLCEVEGYPYLYFPTWDQNYYLSDSIKLMLGDFRIFGDKGLQFLCPFSDGTPRIFRSGDLIGGETAPCIIDLGDYATKSDGDNPRRNPAMSFTVDHLSMRGLGSHVAGGSYETDPRPNGIELTGIHNGPHRPFTFSHISGYNLKSGFYIAGSPDTTINVANLHIEDCEISFCHTGVFSEGRILGSVIKNNNFEANRDGCVRGTFSGSMELSHNMMENTKNPVDIEATSALSLVSKGNYFEYHPTSDFLYRIKANVYYNMHDIDISGNITSGRVAEGAGTQLSGEGFFRVNSQFPVKIKNTSRFILAKGSSIISERGYYELEGMSSGVNHALYIDGGLDLTDTLGEWSHHYPHPDLPREVEQTPFGDQYVADLADGFRINAGESIQGKLVVVNLLIKSNLEGFEYQSVSRAIQARAPGGAFVSGPAAVADYIVRHVSGGEWVLCSIPLVGSNNVSTFEWFVNESLRGAIKVAGATVKVIGPYVADGTEDAVRIYPVCPDFATDGILERGEGPNDEVWVKYSDGRMEMSRTWSAINSNSSQGTLQGLDVFTASRTWTFPEAFVGSPEVYIEHTRSSTDLLSGTQVRNLSSSSVDIEVASLTSFATSSIPRLVAKAEGRWK